MALRLTTKRNPINYTQTEQELFQDYSVPHLASVFDNTDKQNVPAAVDLLRGFRWVRFCVVFVCLVYLLGWVVGVF